jgi:putative pyruvate formate lyase activating enzyme
MILRAIALAAESGLEIPIVYNCGGYESIDSLLILEGVIDIYMPDFKYASADISHRLSNAADYPQAAKAALKEMHRQVGDLCTDERGIAQRGLLVRHLVLPDNMAGTSECMEYIAGDISKNTYLNIMDQYHPCFRAFDYPFLGRRITNQEFAEAIKAALDAGLKRPDRILI